jgi:hypothetical protein
VCQSLVDVEKSEEFTKKLGHKDCKATDVWISQWKSKHDIKLKNTQGKDSADAACAEHWKSIKMPNLLWKFPAYDVYNANDISLFHHSRPDGSLG